MGKTAPKWPVVLEAGRIPAGPLFSFCGLWFRSRKVELGAFSILLWDTLRRKIPHHEDLSAQNACVHTARIRRNLDSPSILLNGGRWRPSKA